MSARIEELLNIANAISHGEIPEYQHNECFTSGAFDLLLIDARGASAYDLLTQLCERFDAVKNKGTRLNGYYYLLTHLARQAETTQVPPGLLAIIEDYPDLSRELQAWYRIAGKQ